MPQPAHASSSLIQRNSTWCNTFHSYDICNDAATLSVSFASSVISGNLLIVAVTVGSNPQVTVLTISDSRGSSFTQAISYSMTNNYAYAYIYYAILTSSGPDTVTATFSAVPYKDPSDPLGGTGIAYLHIFEVSGVTTTGVATGKGAGLLSGVGTISTSSTAFQSGAFLVAIAAEDILTGLWTVGTGFTLSPNPSDDEFNGLSMTEYAVSGVSSPTTFPATLSASGGSDKNWVEVGAAFNPGYSATFLQSGIPSGVTWHVIVGGTQYASTSSSITVTVLSGTVSYTYDASVPGSGATYTCSVNCGGSLTGASTVSATYISNVVPEYPLGLPILAIFMIVMYGLIRRRTISLKNT